MIFPTLPPAATLTRPLPNHLPPSPSPQPIKSSPLQVPPLTPSTPSTTPLPLNPANIIATAPPARLASAAAEAGITLTSLVPSKRLLQLSSAAEVRRYERMTTTVPSTLGEAVPMFLGSPGIVIGVAAASMAAVMRVLQWDFTTVDAASEWGHGVGVGMSLSGGGLQLQPVHRAYGLPGREGSGSSFGKQAWDAGVVGLRIAGR